MATKTLGPDVLWKWEHSLDQALRQQLLSAVESTWSFAHMIAWSYLHDEARGPELIELALEPVWAFACKSSPRPTTQKLTARLRSQVKRLAKQQKKQIREIAEGGSHELDAYAASRPMDPVEMLFLEQIIREFSPQARDIAKYIRMGYTWRDIGETLGVDYSAIRKSFRRETDAILIKLGRGVSIAR